MITPEEFEALPREEQKVLIAKDVIAQIKAGKIKIETGDYIYPLNRVENSKASAREAMLENRFPVCNVCLRGALFLSSVKFKNKLTVDNAIHTGFRYPDDSGLSGAATEFIVFTPEEQALFECMFEDDNGFGDAIIDEDQGNKAVDKRSDYENEYFDLPVGHEDNDFSKDEYIVIRAMRDVIANKGKVVL
jgi:hypothetical protein